VSLAGVLLGGLAWLAAIGKERVALGADRRRGLAAGRLAVPGATAGRQDAPWRRDTTDVYGPAQARLFCGNCDNTGVVTDEEVDRVTDIDLLDERFTPAQEGSRIRITDLVGRARLYRYKLKNGAQRFAEGIAVFIQVRSRGGRSSSAMFTDERERKSAQSIPRIEHRPGLGEPAARGALNGLSRAAIAVGMKLRTARKSLKRGGE